jgi:PAS domain S-box-containing protein
VLVVQDEEHYRDIVENSLDLMCTHDLNGVLLTLNLGAARALGYEPSELINRNVREFLSPKVREELEAYLVVIRETGAASGFMRLRTKSGETRIWKYTNTLRTEGVPVPLVRGMAHDVTDLVHAQKALRESEARLSLAIRAGRMYAFDWDAVTDVIVRTGQCAEILYWLDNPTQDTGQQFVASVHPEDREAYAAPATGLTPDEPTYHTSFRVLRPDGSVLWLETIGRVFFDEHGTRLRIIGMVADVTARKRAEEALSSVSRRLIEAQEEERARIARELHDDLSQRMALLQIGLARFAQNIAGLSSQARQQLHDIAEEAADVSSGIHDLAHQLHPSKLDTLGLVASLEGLCRELSHQHALQVRFVPLDVPKPIPKDVGLCLFRIVQEALRNVVKHSGVAEASVELSGHDDGIVLCISDSGAGFSAETAKARGGLGLVSMRERLRLVGGHLSVESEPSQGTRICIRIPRSSKTGPD